MEKLRLIKCWKALLVLISISMLSVNLYAQSRSVTGTVLDEKGETLIGATVRLKTAKLTTTTDVNGRFTITVPEGEPALVVTYVGYVDQEIALTAQSNNVTVRMSANSRSLNDVVVVGYGTQRKKDVTGSVASISGTTLQEVPASPNVVDQLKGRIAGLDISSNSSTPGSQGQIRLRGERSFATNRSQADAQNGPLFVVDGVPFVGGSLNDLNQDDILSIDVLKDASAAAIYGSRASGGVIIVTTKRGKTGRTIVSLDAYAGISNITKKYPFMNGAQFAAFKQESINGNPAKATGYPFTAAELQGIANGTSTNWQDYIYRKGLLTNDQLSISGGNENTQFSISGGYYYEKGTQVTQDFSRASLRAVIDHNVSKRVKVGVTTFGTLTNSNAVTGILYNTLAISPLTSPYNADGTINLLPMKGSVDEPNRVNPLTLNNPYIQALNRRVYSFNSVYGEVNILDGLKYRLSASYTFGQTRGQGYSPISTIVNSNTTTDKTAENLTNNENFTWLIENLVTYDKVFAQKHHLTLTGLYSAERDQSQGITINGNGMPADYLQSYNLFFANTLFINGSNQPYYSRRNLLSYMARANYVFNGKYLLTATVRTDGSSVLTQGNKYFTYPAFALGWNIDQENFMKNIKFVNTLKLRAGYGVTADQSINPYQVLGNLSSNAYNYGSNGQIGYLVTNLPNNLKFEHTNNYNLGVDFGLFNNRLTGTVDYYQQRTYDILQQQTLPASNGAQTTLVNAGSSKGNGVEVSLSSVNLRSKNGLNWSTDFNISFVRNSIVDLHDNLQQDIVNGWFVGQPFNIIYDYKKVGIWQTSEAAEAAKYSARPGQIKIEDVNRDNKIDAADRQIQGSYQPKFVSGLTNRFSFKGIDLTFVAFARIGQKVAVTYLGADSGGSGYPFFNSGRVNQYNVNYWTPTNPTQDFPQPDASLTGPNNGSTLQYRDGSFIKMRSINLGYTFGSTMIKRAGFSSLRVYASCNNPFIIYSPLVRQGLAIDPEGNGYGNQLQGASSFSADALSRAVTIGLANPPSRTFSLGFNAKF
ncbi:SusC/RagA family TonB-linked outer membrane protein [Mucilaginibacter lacusdianchii]|uniref:SusC/RagA family TonB-linked outer membrane protein n=1 Tax=Mucilaginibacter lacusdianchii TaxID=2684211 RepID=UPI00131D7681|nr:TonB-dependent receptor [Mucilaginibacter sp. JXJ CY 39]